MTFELFLNLYALVANMLTLVVCLLHFVAQPRRGWLYGTLVMLPSLMSNYYWGSYTLLLQGSPTLSSGLAYAGWNIGYLFQFLLTLHFMPKKFRFHPVYLTILLPIVLNILQFKLYLSFCYDTTSLLITIWQCFICTLIICAGLHSVFHHLVWKEGQTPYVSWMMILFALSEFGLWTASCFDWPSDLLNPYYYCSIFCFATYVGMAWAIRKTYEASGIVESNAMDRGFQLLLQVTFLLVLLLFCGGGLVLGAWMRDRLMAGTQGAVTDSTYEIIEVMLFIFSFVVVLFSLAIMMVAGLSQKAAESNELRKAKSIAEHSNAAKSDFLASMSHEIRTPINAVLGMNEMILRESLQARDLLPRERETIRNIFSKICAYSGNIESAGNNLLSIINDILDFSKIEAGKIELVPGPISSALCSTM